MEIENISYKRLKILLIIGLIILILGIIINERHILGIGIGFTLRDIILLIYKRKDKKEN